MKITILNSSVAGTTFDKYLLNISEILQSEGHIVNNLLLRDEDMRYCIGCWDCWVKTPGQCQANDASVNVDTKVINSDLVLFASPTRMGFVNARLKKTMDKIIPLLLPYIDVVEDEAHHKKRYDEYPAIGLIVDPAEDTDQDDLTIIRNIFSRMSLNFRSQLRFMATTDDDQEEVIEKIIHYADREIPLPAYQKATTGCQINPPKHLTVFNGSPRGKKSNTGLVFAEFLKGFEAAGGMYEMHYLIQAKRREEQVEAFKNAECVLVGHPLYTDAMPGSVMDFFEHLEPLVGQNNPPIMFLVQSGFPEPGQSRYEEQYLQKLAERLGSTYLGTIVKGGVEGIQIMPENMTKNLYSKMYALGKGFGEEGWLDSVKLKELAGKEFYSGFRAFVQKLVARLPVAGFYWDNQLKANDAYEDRFARPFEE